MYIDEGKEVTKMGKGLEGKRVVIGASRKIEEISKLIENQGGIPVVRSLQGTVFLAEKEVEPALIKFVNEGADWVIFTTGIGTETLVNITEKLGVKAEYLKRLEAANIAIRGYKTKNYLKKIGVVPDILDEDGSTRGLIRALEDVDFAGKNVLVQLHGETASRLIQFLEDKGASVATILPYQHIAPEWDAVQTLFEEMHDNKVDAVCFTSAIQVRSLFTFAKEKGVTKEILDAFQDNTLAVAVGKVTAEALSEEGVDKIVVPELERMGAMIIELSRYYEGNNVNS